MLNSFHVLKNNAIMDIIRTSSPSSSPSSSSPSSSPSSSSSSSSSSPSSSSPSYSFSSSSMCDAGGNPAYRTSAFEAVCTLTPVLGPPVIFRDAPRQTA
jgi:hypothetical protein